MNIKRAAVVGAGQGACTMAADMASKGLDVRILEHSSQKERLAALQSRKILVKGIMGEWESEVSYAGENPYEALENVDLINVVIPSFAHQNFAELIAPYAKSNQKLIVWAGNLGSLIFRDEIKKAGSQMPQIYEANTIPYGTRFLDRNKNSVHCLVAADQTLIAGLGGADTSELSEISKLFGTETKFVFGKNSLEAALNNPNPMIHPPAALMNIGHMEYVGGDFYMYRTGITNTVSKVIKSIYDEACKIAAAYGLKVRHFDEKAFYKSTSIMGDVFCLTPKPSDTKEIIAGIKGPSTIHDRYISEDCPYALVAWSEIGRVAGVKTPTVDAMVNLTAAMYGKDLWSEGRNLASLGLASLSKDEILAKF